MIPVTKPFLPDIEKYNLYVQDIWQRKWLTNMGPLASNLEIKLKNQIPKRLQLDKNVFEQSSKLSFYFYRSIDIKKQIC